MDEVHTVGIGCEVQVSDVYEWAYVVDACLLAVVNTQEAEGVVIPRIVFTSARVFFTHTLPVAWPTRKSLSAVGWGTNFLVLLSVMSAAGMEDTEQCDNYWNRNAGMTEEVINTYIESGQVVEIVRKRLLFLSWTVRRVVRS